MVATDGEEGGVGVDQGRREGDHIAVALRREACGRDVCVCVCVEEGCERKVVKGYRHGGRGGCRPLPLAIANATTRS